MNKKVEKILGTSVTLLGITLFIVFGWNIHTLVITLCGLGMIVISLISK